MKSFEAFRETLSAESLKSIYEESKLEIAPEEFEGTEAFSVALATQMAVNLIEHYQNWLKVEK
ncbi:hypothetical protein [Streptococcus porci]|uniref:hypothetical protein n=1 Tax=Streptococcus porci TaxID=502567 RepID=UPI000406D5B2|nr:hypothetical protein [Streptococcus porci]